MPRDSGIGRIYTRIGPLATISLIFAWDVVSYAEGEQGLESSPSEEITCRVFPFAEANWKRWNLLCANEPYFPGGDYGGMAREIVDPCFFWMFRGQPAYASQATAACENYHAYRAWRAQGVFHDGS